MDDVKMRVSLSEYLNVSREQQVPFGVYLNVLMEKKGMSNTQLAKRIGVNQPAISKIISGVTKKPERETIYYIVLALELSMEEADELLEAAGFRWRKVVFDAYIKHCITIGAYNVRVLQEFFYEKNIKC